MSNREIIEWLKKKAEAVPMPGARKMYEAAAKALEAAQPEHGTNLAEVGTDCISREQAIKTVGWYSCHSGDELLFADNALRQLPPIQPVIVPCDYAKACNEATMDKLTSAVAYYDALEELRKHGYVLVNMREVTT